MCVCLHTLTECRCLLHCTDYFRPVNILAGLPGVYCFILSSLFLILERYERNSFNWCCCAYILMSLCRLWLFKECLVIQVAQNIVGRNSAYTECVFTAQRSYCSCFSLHSAWLFLKHASWSLICMVEIRRCPFHLRTIYPDNLLTSPLLWIVEVGLYST